MRCTGRRRGYCFKRPQYFCKPLPQQPVLMHIDWRAPQLVTQIGIVERSGLLLQFAMQIFCSPLQRMGAAAAIWCQNGTRPSRAAPTMMILRCADMKTGESVRCFAPVLG